MWPYFLQNHQVKTSNQRCNSGSRKYRKSIGQWASLRNKKPRSHPYLLHLKAWSSVSKQGYTPVWFSTNWQLSWRKARLQKRAKTVQTTILVRAQGATKARPKNQRKVDSWVTFMWGLIDWMTATHRGPQRRGVTSRSYGGLTTPRTMFRSHSQSKWVLLCWLSTTVEPGSRQALLSIAEGVGLGHLVCRISSRKRDTLTQASHQYSLIVSCLAWTRLWRDNTTGGRVPVQIYSLPID